MLQYHAHFVDMTLLRCIFTVIMSTVGVLTSPGYSIRFPPTVSLVRFGSSFSGLYVQTVLPYVTCLWRSSGISSFLMKTCCPNFKISLVTLEAESWISFWLFCCFLLLAFASSWITSILFFISFALWFSSAYSFSGFLVAQFFEIIAFYSEN